MKLLYITFFLALGVHAYAQETRKASENEIQEAINYKAAKEFEATMMKEAQQRAAETPSAARLASEEGLPVKPKLPTTSDTPQNRKEKLFSSRDLTIQEIRRTIPWE
jgi:hypothetical protein